MDSLLTDCSLGPELFKLLEAKLKRTSEDLEEERKVRSIYVNFSCIPDTQWLRAEKQLTANRVGRFARGKECVNQRCQRMWLQGTAPKPGR